MVFVEWWCSGCSFPCSCGCKTLINLVKGVHESCISCEHELEKISIEGLSEELSMEIFLMGKENLKLHYENEVLKIKNGGN